jgi:multidrug efflux pump subunit AcrB
VPITVSLSENARRDIDDARRTCRFRLGRRLGAAEAVADIGFGSGPTTIQRSNQLRRLAVGADLARACRRRRLAKVMQLPRFKNLPQGVQKMNLGNQKWQAELLFNFAIA